MRSIARLALAAACLFAGPVALTAQQAPTPADDPPRPLVAVHVAGLQRYAHDDIVRFTGLRPGQLVTEGQLTALAQQLADTGLFTGIRYEYTTTEEGLTARFTVNEPRWTIPVVFDNFIGLTDEQLIDAVAQYVPAFNGTAVAEGATNNLIGTALQRVLADLGRPGRVVVIPRVNIEENWTLYAFAVTDTGRDMTVCAIGLPGASAAHTNALLASLAGLRGQAYSRSEIQILTEGTLLDYYRRRGYWGAAFARPQAALDDGCGGVSVTVPVTEGIVYRVGGVRWEGNSALAAPVLDAAFDVEPESVANVVEVEDALLDVRQQYERAGHLLEQHTLDHELDEAAARVTFVVRIDEGPELRMGRFEIEGLPASAAADLAARWQIQQGDIFDGTYVQRFMTDQRALIQRDDAPFMTVDVVVERSTGLVHVKVLPAR